MSCEHFLYHQYFFPSSKRTHHHWIRPSIPEGVQGGTVLRQITSLNAPLRIKRTQFVTREIKVSSHRWIRTRGGFFSVTGRGDRVDPPFPILYRRPMPARQPTRCNIPPVSPFPRIEKRSPKLCPVPQSHHPVSPIFTSLHALNTTPWMDSPTNREED